MDYRRRLLRYLPLIPLAVIFIAFFLVPVANLFVLSFLPYSRLTGTGSELTLQNYQAILHDSFELWVIGRTIGLALCVSAMSCLMAWPVALFLVSAPKRLRSLVIIICLSPLLISVVVRTLGWVVLLGPNGVLDTLAALIGAGPLKILHSDAAVVIGLVNVLLPFALMAITISLQAINPSVLKAAASLGADRREVLLRVILPLSLPGVVSGGVITFSLAASTFLTPAVLGGAGYQILARSIYEQATMLNNLPMAGALSLVLTVLVLLASAVPFFILRRGKYRAITK